MIEFPEKGLYFAISCYSTLVNVLIKEIMRVLIEIADDQVQEGLQVLEALAFITKVQALSEDPYYLRKEFMQIIADSEEEFDF